MERSVTGSVEEREASGSVGVPISKNISRLISQTARNAETQPSQTASFCSARGKPRRKCNSEGILEMPSHVSDLEFLANDFLIYGRQRGYSEHTLRSYGKAVTDFLRFLSGSDLRDLKPRRIGEWIDRLLKSGVSRNTVSARLYALRAFLDRVVVLDLMPSNPARVVSVRRYTRRLPRAISEEDVARLIDSAETMLDRALIEILYATGCRLSEVANMRVENISWSARTIKVLGKGSKERLVLFGRKAARALKRYLGRRRFHDGFVFDALRWMHPYRGDHISDYAIRQIVLRAARRAGLGHVHPHQLRHSFASHLLDHGADLISIKDLLGHTSISTTQIYCSVSQTHLREQMLKAHPRWQDERLKVTNGASK
jgi:site-specific recombinase XerD